jgi:hypothetical protein
MVITGVAAFAVLFHRPAAPPPEARKPVVPAQPSAHPTTPAPYNGNFAILPAAPQSIPNDAFSRAALTAPVEPAADDRTRSLQEDLKRFGLYGGAINGLLDAPTRKSLRVITDITGMQAGDADAASRAMRAAEERAEGNLWMLGVFPFGSSLPSWLLASLDTADAETLQQAFTRHFISGRKIFSVLLKAPGLIVRARLFPRQDSNEHTSCYAFSALFERGDLQHHVISRACRDGAAHWAMAAHDRPRPTEETP